MKLHIPWVIFIGREKHVKQAIDAALEQKKPGQR